MKKVSSEMKTIHIKCNDTYYTYYIYTDLVGSNPIKWGPIKDIPALVPSA